MPAAGRRIRRRLRRNKLEARLRHAAFLGLPFRFLAAARYAPQWEPALEEAMLKCVAGQEKLAGGGLNNKQFNVTGEYRRVEKQKK